MKLQFNTNANSSPKFNKLNFHKCKRFFEAERKQQPTAPKITVIRHRLTATLFCRHTAQPHLYATHFPLDNRMITTDNGQQQQQE